MPSDQPGGERSSHAVGPARVAHSAPTRRECLQASRQLHALYRQLRFERKRTLRHRATYLARRARERLLGDPQTWREARQWARDVAAAGGPSVVQQLARLWWLCARYGVTPEMVYRYRLYETGRAADAELYFELNEYIKLRGHLYQHLGVDAGTLSDKRSFYQACVRAGLPTIPMLAEFEGGTMTKWHDGAEQWLDGALFSKQATAYGGVDAHCWTHENDRYRDGAGRTLALADLLEELSRQSRSAPFVLQPHMLNDPALGPVSGGALCTVRVLTARSAHGPPEVVRGIFRMSVGTGPVDNFGGGGLASPIDERTGRLGRATRKFPPHATPVDRHPDTGESIEGFVLPYWPDVVALALRAHAVFSQFPSVGWDVAITHRGLTLLEGNYNWGVTISQQPHGQPIGATQFPLYYLTFLREPAPTRATPAAIEPTT